MQQVGRRDASGVLVLATTLMCTLIALTGCGSGSSSNAGAVPRSSVSTGTAHAQGGHSSEDQAPVHVTPAVRRATRHSASAYVQGSLALLRDPNAKGSTRILSAAGAALHVLLNQRAEYAQSDYRVVGQARVVGQRIISARKHPARLVVDACVDNSRVHVLDKSGHQAPGQNAPKRVRNEFTLVQRGRTWVVTKTGFAANPVC